MPVSAAYLPCYELCAQSGELSVTEWLVQRRVVSSSWQKSLRTVHSKLQVLLEHERPNVPGVSDALPQLKRREEVTYFDCVKVLNLLIDAGRGNKNFLGQYIDAETAQWADVVKKFESGAIFLVDTAHFLVHHVTYELPALKKELSRTEKELAELQRRCSEGVY